ncbi:beta-lactamase family protein [Acidobacteria bacterium AB60]|nr:beta-lactamase family protein [Acidobacteria bacterium AB60]
MKAVLQTYVDSGQLAGAATLWWGEGETGTACVGRRDVEAGLPVERDTIFRIASMTKPITSVAALMLVDEGRIALGDPITQFAPEFAEMRVLRTPNGPLEETDPAERLITFEDLLTQRAGLTYGSFHRGPIGAVYRQVLGWEIDSALSPDAWIAGLAGLPLIGQPGAGLTYGCATDLLGLLIARIEGRSLGEVLRRRIFDPLGMADTGFVVPAEKRGRRAAAYGFDESGRLVRVETREGAFLAERPAEMTFESGSGGLWSIVDDYLRFARLFLGDGAVDGVRLLQPETLRRMMTNQLGAGQPVHPAWMGFLPGRGFGLGVSVVLESSSGDFMRRGHPGTVSWPGAFGGWWEADPVDGIVRIFLAHNMVDLAQMAKGVGLGVWAAIDAFQRETMKGVKE